MKLRAALLMVVLLTAVVLTGCNSSKEPSMNLNEETNPAVTPQTDNTEQLPGDAPETDSPAGGMDEAPADNVTGS